MAAIYEYEEDEFSGSGGGKKGRSSRLSSHNYLKATRSNNPQAILRIPSHARGAGARTLMEYISRSDRGESIEVEDERGRFYSGKEEINEIYNDWSEDFERAKPNAKRLPRHVSHIILSGDIEPTSQNIAKVQSAATNTCRELLDGYKYLIGVHQEGGKAHAHVVVKAKSREKNVPKLRLGPSEVQIIRENFAKNLSDYGLHHVATLRRDRPKEFEKIKEGKEPLKSKTRNRFSHALDEKSSSGYLAAVDSQIVKLREKIDKSALKDNERYYLKQSLRRYEKLLFADPDNSRDHVPAMYKEFTQYLHLFKEDISKVINPPKIKKVTPDRDRVSNLVDIKVYSEIKKTRTKIKSIEDPQKRTLALQVLDRHSKALIGKPLTKLRDKDIPPGEMVNNLRKDIRRYDSLYNAIENDLKNDKLSSPDRFLIKNKRDELDTLISKIIRHKKSEISSLSLPRGMKYHYENKIDGIKKEHAKQHSRGRDRGMGMGR